MDSVAIPTDGMGFNGAGLGAGFIGGLVLGSIWNGGGFWGGNGRGAGQAAADATIVSGLQNLSNQNQQNAISQLQSANQLGMQVAGAAANVTAGVNANTVSALQSQNVLQGQLCNGFSGLSREIDATGDQAVAAINASTIQAMQTAQNTNDRLCAINNNITSQGADTRLLASQLVNQLQMQHADLKAQISDENCKDRELMREIAAQATRDELAKAQAKIVQLETQNYVQQSNSQQTLYLIDQLKPTTTTAAAGA